MAFTVDYAALNTIGNLSMSTRVRSVSPSTTTTFEMQGIQLR